MTLHAYNVTEVTDGLMSTRDLQPRFATTARRAATIAALDRARQLVENGVPFDVITIRPHALDVSRVSLAFDLDTCHRDKVEFVASAR